MLNQYHQQIVTQLKREAALGLVIEDAITQLHQQGFSIIASMRVLRAVYGISLKEAKDYVSNHPAWESLTTATKPLHEELIANVSELLKSSVGEPFAGTGEITIHEKYSTNAPGVQQWVKVDLVYSLTP